MWVANEEEVKPVFQPYSDLDKYQALSEILETYDQGLSARLSLHSSVNFTPFS